MRACVRSNYHHYYYYYYCRRRRCCYQTTSLYPFPIKIITTRAAQAEGGYTVSTTAWCALGFLFIFLFAISATIEPRPGTGQTLSSAFGGETFDVGDVAPVISIEHPKRTSDVLCVLFVCLFVCLFFRSRHRTSYSPTRRFTRTDPYAVRMCVYRIPTTMAYESMSRVFFQANPSALTKTRYTENFRNFYETHVRTT